MKFTDANELTLLLRLVLCTVFGILLGIERHKYGRIAGIRTFATIALGTAVFTIFASKITDGELNPTIIAGIVIGAALLSAKMLVVEHGIQQDFSNIAAVWATAAISSTIAVGMYVLGGGAAALLLGIFWLKDVYQPNK
jgi:putative Mg2+ transporter-C (MgtC) family protein